MNELLKDFRPRFAKPASSGKKQSQNQVVKPLVYTCPSNRTVMTDLPPPPPGQNHEIHQLSLELVLDSPYQPRQRAIAKRDVEELIRSISANGQTAPIIAARADGKNSGKYYVHSGHRRCAALRFLGAPTVKALVVEVDEREARRIALADNLGREDLTAYEQAMALKEYRDAFGLEVEPAGKELGLKRRTAYRLTTILSASEDLLTLIADERLSARAAELLVKIEAKNPRKALRLARRFAASTVTLHQLEAEYQDVATVKKSAPAHKDIVLTTKGKSVAFEVRLNRSECTPGQRRRLLETINELFGFLGIRSIDPAVLLDSERGAE